VGLEIPSILPSGQLTRPERVRELGRTRNVYFSRRKTGIYPPPNDPLDLRSADASCALTLIWLPLM